MILLTGGTGYIGSHTAVELLCAGDLPAYYADPAKAERVLGWRAEKTLEEMCRDAWRWQQNCR